MSRGATEAGHLARTKRIQIDQVELSMTDAGQGPPLILIHGFPLDHTMWNEQIVALAKARRVIAPDLRGFGASQVPPGTATMEQMADDIAAILDALEIREPIALVGLSMGGYVAFQFVRKYGHRLGALVLADTRSSADAPEAAAGRLKLAAHVLAAGTGYAADAMIPRAFAPESFQRKAALIEF